MNNQKTSRIFRRPVSIATVRRVPIAILIFAGIWFGARANSRLQANEPGQLVRQGEPIQIDAAFLADITLPLRENQPALLAAAARVKAMEAGVGAVRTWEDPMFKFGGAVGRQREETIMFMGPPAAHTTVPTMSQATIMMGFDPRDDGDLAYGLEQKLPLFGKARAMKRIAESEAALAGGKLEAAFQDARRRVAQTVLRTALADLAVELGKEDIQWLEKMSGLMLEKVRANTATTVEFTRTENELLKRRERLRVEGQESDQLRVELNRLLGRSTTNQWPVFKLPGTWGELKQPERLMELALRNDPRLKVSRGEVAVADASVQAARRSKMPDVSLGIDGRQYSGNGSFREGMFSVTLNLPWFNARKYGKDVARELGKEEAAQHELRDMELSVRAEIEKLLRGIDAARREATLYRSEILPRTERSLELAHAAWLSGKGMSSDVFEARRMRIEARTMESRAIAEQWSMLSELALCCGVGDLEALDMTATHTAAGHSKSRN